MDLRFWKGAFTAGLTAAGALLGLAALLAWFWRRRSRKRLVSHVVRLALDIVSVSESVDEDLANQPGSPLATMLRARSRACRETAESFLFHRERLNSGPAIRVMRALEALHEEHRRVVDLRLEVDVALASWRRSPRLGAPRSMRFSPTSKRGLSHSRSSGFYTQPSTLV